MQFYNITPEEADDLKSWYASVLADYKIHKTRIRNFTYTFVAFGVVGHFLLCLTIYKTKELRSLFYRLLFFDSVLEALACIGFALLARGNNDRWGCKSAGLTVKICDDLFSAIMLKISWPAMAITFKEHSTAVQIVMLWDRFVAIKFPLFYKSHMTEKIQKRIFLGILLVFAIMFPALYWVSYYDSAITTQVTNQGTGNVTGEEKIQYLATFQRYSNAFLATYFDVVHKYLSMVRDCALILSAVIVNSAVVRTVWKQVRKQKPKQTKAENKTSANKMQTNNVEELNKNTPVDKQHNNTTRNNDRQAKAVENEKKKLRAMSQMLVLTTSLTVCKCLVDVVWAVMKSRRFYVNELAPHKDPWASYEDLSTYYSVKAAALRTILARDVCSVAFALNFYALMIFVETFRKAFLTMIGLGKWGQTVAPTTTAPGGARPTTNVAMSIRDKNRGQTKPQFSKHTLTTVHA